MALNNSGYFSASTPIPQPGKYRTTVFAGLKPHYVQAPIIDRRRTYTPATQLLGSDLLSPDHHNAVFHYAPTEAEWRAALLTRRIGHKVLVVDVTQKPNGSLRTDEVIPVNYVQVYDFFTIRVRGAAMTQAHRFMPVRPQMNESALETFSASWSAEEAAKTLNLKLPRIINQGTTNTGPSSTHNNLEELRAKIVSHARSDDYGHRLFQMARLVLHAKVVADAGRRHDPSTILAPAASLSIFNAETLTLSPQELDAGYFVYLEDEQDPRYRAFLTLALYGVENFVGETQTVYSGMKPHAEIFSLRDSITWVQKSGPALAGQIDVMSLQVVLGDPEFCLSALYSYATSLGLGRHVLTILRQTAVMPFMFKRLAYLPYRCVVSPKADVYGYLLATVDSQYSPIVLDVRDMLSSAPIFAMAAKAGIAWLAFSYQNSAMLNSTQLTSAIMSLMVNSVTAETWWKCVWEYYLGDHLAYYHLNPFLEDQYAATAACSSALRDYGFLMSQYTTQLNDVALRVFASGTDMRAVSTTFDTEYRAYAESIVLATVEMQPWTLESEMLPIANQDHALKQVGGWLAAIQWYSYMPAVRGVGLGVKSSPMGGVPPRGGGGGGGGPPSNPSDGGSNGSGGGGAGSSNDSIYSATTIPSNPGGGGGGSGGSGGGGGSSGVPPSYVRRNPKHQKPSGSHSSRHTKPSTLIGDNVVKTTVFDLRRKLFDNIRPESSVSNRAVDDTSPKDKSSKGKGLVDNPSTRGSSPSKKWNGRGPRQPTPSPKRANPVSVIVPAVEDPRSPPVILTGPTPLTPAPDITIMNIVAPSVASGASSRAPSVVPPPKPEVFRDAVEPSVAGSTEIDLGPNVFKGEALLPTQDQGVTKSRKPSIVGGAIGSLRRSSAPSNQQNIAEFLGKQQPRSRASSVTSAHSGKKSLGSRVASLVGLERPVVVIAESDPDMQFRLPGDASSDAQLPRGVLENSEREAIEKAGTDSDKLLALCAQIKTNDGRSILIEKLAANHPDVAAGLYGKLNAGGLGNTGFDKWVHALPDSIIPKTVAWSNQFAKRERKVSSLIPKSARAKDDTLLGWTVPVRYAKPKKVQKKPNTKPEQKKE